MKIKTTSIFIVVMVFLSGCAASGSASIKAVPAFQVAAIPEDTAAVYFYRPPAFASGGVGLRIADNGKEIVRLGNGKYFRYLVAPGHHKFQTKSGAIGIDQPVEFDLVAGETYFVRSGSRQGFWEATVYLGRVYPEEALKELPSCCKP